MKSDIENILGTYQRDQHSNKPTIDKTSTFEQVIEKLWEYNIESRHIFIDYKSVHDTLDRYCDERNAIANSLINYGKANINTCRIPSTNSK